MEMARKIVLFSTNQFYAIVGTIRMRENPYSLSMPDIFNNKSSATHRARDHEHKPGKIFLSDTEFYALNDNTERVCRSITSIHISLKDMRAAIDFHPEKHQGSAMRRKEYAEGVTATEIVRFTLHAHALSGMADRGEIYRRSERFVGINGVHIDDVAKSAGPTLPEFLERIGCPQPEHMAVHLGNVLHS